MHAGLISCLEKVLKEVGVPTSAMLTKARIPREGEDKTVPKDIVVLD
jgi:hypothetical protein